MPNIPNELREEFSYLLGLDGDGKDEFTNRIFDKKPVIVDDLTNYNEDKYCAIDGLALKNCDRLAAFIEAVLSISYGVKSKELSSGTVYIKKNLKEKGSEGLVNFYDLAVEIEKYLMN
jgi:putative hydrolase of HD superfamily